MTFNMNLFETAVDEYVSLACTITYNWDETTTMRRVYDDFQRWTKKRGNSNFLDGGTIQRFGQCIRVIERRENLQLVRGRSGRPSRWVEVYILPSYENENST